MSEIVATFKPFENLIDFDKTLGTLRSTLSKADDGELFLEKACAENFLFDDGKLKNAGYSSSEGFGIRAVSEDRLGYAHSSSISNESIKRAGEAASIVTLGNPNPTTDPKLSTIQCYRKLDPMTSEGFDEKIALLKEINAYARALDRRVDQVSVNISASLQEIIILRSSGRLVTDIRPMVKINITIIVDHNGQRESGSSGSGGRVDLKNIIQQSVWKNHVHEALRIALVNLRAKPAPAGVMDVVLGPGWPGILLHEAVGHGLEGDFNRKKTSAFSNLLGEVVASENVTVIDDGTLQDKRGSINFDDEGTPSQRNILIENGRLVNFMQDRQNARIMGMEVTGNGRRQGYANLPMPRMTNTVMLSGNESPQTILENLKDGIYAVGFSGGQVDITNGKFVFSCTEAYRIKKGKSHGPIKGATLIGDGVSAMKKVREVGNDMSLDPGIGNCGKAGQWVPVGVGQPTLLIGGLTVGGRKS